MRGRSIGRRVAAVVLVAASVGAAPAVPPTGAQAPTGVQARPAEPPPPQHAAVVLDRPFSAPTVFRGRLYFTARAEGKGWELWRSDGTRRGTRLLKDVFPGRPSSSPTLLFPARKHLYFFTDRPRRQELWRTDGTRRGTVRVARVGWVHTRNLAAATVGNRLFFISPSRKGWSLWRSDGTRAGTVPLRTRLKPAWDDVTESPQMVRMGGRLFFHAGDRERGKELWTSDGTRRGTKLVKDIRPGPGHSLPDELTVVGRTLYFTAATARGRELWRSDGTRAGTVLVEDISDDPRRAPGSLTAVGQRLYFVAADDLHGVELWTSDGTEAGTRMVANLAPDAQYDARSSAPYDLVPAGDRLFFTASADGGPHELWVTDGTEAGTRQVTDRPADGCDGSGLCGVPRPRLGAPDGTLRFVVPAGREEVEGPELWYSDGTPAGTRLLDEFSPVPRWNPVIDDLLVARGTVFLTARESVRGQWLLKLVDGPPRRPTCHGLPATITGSGRITGTSRADVIVGSSGADTIDGRGGDDVICAGEGDDTVLQGDRPDGWDSIDGQDGVDTVSYARRTTPVRIDLRATEHPRSGATSSTPHRPDEIDALTLVENGVGGAAADFLEGDGAPNRLEGGPGSDSITGEHGDDVEVGGPGADTFRQGVDAGAGADLILGQGGRDTVTYSPYGPAVTVTLDGLANDGVQGEGDNVSVEVVVGSINDDTIVGDGSANWFYGGYGSDTLVGGGGPDHLFGEAGSDVLDVRDGVGGNDVADGGDGADTATWDPGDRLVAVP